MNAAVTPEDRDNGWRYADVPRHRLLPWSALFWRDYLPPDPLD